MGKKLPEGQQIHHKNGEEHSTKGSIVGRRGNGFSGMALVAFLFLDKSAKGAGVISVKSI
jgi:hypothetical protein